MSLFTEEYPSLESYWRSVVLFGQNVASYKFALAKSLLEVSPRANTFIPLEDLSEPFSRHILEHLKLSDKQITSKSSTFIDACRQFNAGTLDKEELIRTTVKYGYANVLDAFHVVNREEIPVKFFEKVTNGRQKGIVLTDSIFRLKESVQNPNLPHEVEARWNLVETAWKLGMKSSLIAVHYDEADNLFYAQEDKLRRTAVTSARNALNGYQKGKCFYCFRDINVDPSSDDLADVDHFYPHTLKRQTSVNLDGVWNLVLACKSCNRGENGKFARVPAIHLLARLHKRNNFFIESHHPLRETLILQTGKTEKDRHSYILQVDKMAINALIHRWQPLIAFSPAF